MTNPENRNTAPVSERPAKQSDLMAQNLFQTVNARIEDLGRRGMLHPDHARYVGGVERALADGQINGDDLKGLLVLSLQLGLIHPEAFIEQYDEATALLAEENKPAAPAPYVPTRAEQLFGTNADLHRPISEGKASAKEALDGLIYVERRAAQTVFAAAAGLVRGAFTAVSEAARNTINPSRLARTTTDDAGNTVVENKPSRLKAFGTGLVQGARTGFMDGYEWGKGYMENRPYANHAVAFAVTAAVLPLNIVTGTLAVAGLGTALTAPMMKDAAEGAQAVRTAWQNRHENVAPAQSEQPALAAPTNTEPVSTPSSPSAATPS